METLTDDAEGLVAGILADAEAEGRRIIAEAEAYAAESAARAGERAGSILSEAASKAAAQAAAIRAEAAAKAAVERRQRRLAFQEGLVRSVVAKARARIASMVDTPEYRSALLRWLAEAASGLAVESATVAVSRAERPLVDRAALDGAGKACLEAAGVRCALRLAEADSARQGVYLSADGGRLAYDGTVDTRFEREGPRLRAMIHEALFQGGTAGKA